MNKDDGLPPDELTDALLGGSTLESAIENLGPDPELEAPDPVQEALLDDSDPGETARVVERAEATDLLDLIVDDVLPLDRDDSGLVKRARGGAADLGSHFEAGAQHHERLARLHQKCAEAYRSVAELQERGGAPQTATKTITVSSAFHKLIAQHYDGLRKLHEQHARHHREMKDGK